MLIRSTYIMYTLGVADRERLEAKMSQVKRDANMVRGKLKSKYIYLDISIFILL